MLAALALAGSTLFTAFTSGSVNATQTDGRGAQSPPAATATQSQTTPAKTAASSAKPDSTLAGPQDITPVVATTTVAFVFLVFIGLFVYETSYKRKEIGVQSHWGGFGGGLGGWRAAPSLFYFVGAVLFGVMLTVLASGTSISLPTTFGASSDAAARKAANDTTKKGAADTTKKGGDTAKKKA
jgi:hypothetical protein